MKKLLASLLLITVTLFTGSAFAGDCLSRYTKVSLPHSEGSGNLDTHKYACISEFPKQLNNICPRLFSFQPIAGDKGFACQLLARYKNRMCKDSNGVSKGSQDMRFNLPRSVHATFSEEFKEQFKRHLGHKQAVIMYTCEDIF